MKIEFHPDAADELSDAAQYYEERQDRLGRRFLDSIDEALSFLKKAPRSGIRTNGDEENNGSNGSPT